MCIYDDFKIIIHTGSGDSSPNWSEDKYFELIKNILREHNPKTFKNIADSQGNEYDIPGKNRSAK